MRGPLSDKEKVELLSEELRRARLVWNYFAGTIASGFYPVRTLGERNIPWPGEEGERLFAIFKVMDHEVRQMGDVLHKAGTNDPRNVHQEEFEKIFDRLKEGTELVIPAHS